MSESEALVIARQALCCLWVELDRLLPDIVGCMHVVDDALAATGVWPPKSPSIADVEGLNGEKLGLDAWPDTQEGILEMARGILRIHGTGYMG